MNDCELFQKISADVWDTIARNRRRNTRTGELRITETIIDTIQNYVEDEGVFSVFAQKMKTEVTTGGDIEIYLQDGHNSFSRVLLQAKIVEVNGNLQRLDKYSGSTRKRQFDTLIGYGDSVNCPTYYLIYNGIDEYREEFEDCAGLHDEKQYGCALIDPSIIKEYCNEYGTGTLPGFLNNRPIGKPWRSLNCCYAPLGDQEYFSYSKEQIDMDPYFSKLFTPPELIEFVLAGQQPKPKSRLQLINERLHDSGWNPSARIIVSNRKMEKNGNLLKFKL